MLARAGAAETVLAELGRLKRGTLRIVAGFGKPFRQADLAAQIHQLLSADVLRKRLRIVG